MSNQDAWMLLNAIPGLSGSIIKRLMGVSSDPEKILYLSRDELISHGIDPVLAANFIHFPKDKFLETEYNFMHKEGVECLTISDQEYPSSLSEIGSAPLVLYIKGNRKLLSAVSVALVGSRKASYYGMKIARQLAEILSMAGITVVSGGALGIDTASHQGALDSKGQTIAVMGCGFNHIYPKQNKRLFEDIVKGKGLLLCEYPMDTGPLNFNFPRRNRIISALSIATVVVEAAEKSGALITADYANEQNKEVFAVPGNMDSLYSQGTNRLIQDGARMILSGIDLIEQLGLKMRLQSEVDSKVPQVHLTIEEHSVLELITHQPIHIDMIMAQSGKEIGYLMAQMLSLELKGLIKQLPGQYYVRS